MLGEFSQSAYQRSVPVKLSSAWSICLLFFPVILQWESHIWQSSHLNSNLPCNMVFKGWLGPCPIIIFSDSLIVIWPHFHTVASLGNARMSVNVAGIKYLFWCYAKENSGLGAVQHRIKQERLLAFQVKVQSYTLFELIAWSFHKAKVNDLISLTQSRDIDIISLQRVLKTRRLKFPDLGQSMGQVISQ